MATASNELVNAAIGTTADITSTDDTAIVTCLAGAVQVTETATGDPIIRLAASPGDATKASKTLTLGTGFNYTLTATADNTTVNAAI